MKETIFHLENRKGFFMYHFIYLNLAGLYYIENKIYDVKANDANKNGSTFPLLNKVVSKPSQEIVYPIKIHMNNVLQFHREAFDIIKDKFILIEDLDKLNDYEVVNIYGGYPGDLRTIDSPKTIPYIRNLFLSRIKIKPCNIKKNIYLTRKQSAQFHNGTLKRHMKNEEMLMKTLKEYDFEYIILENLTFKEKIELFMNAKTVISPNSGGLSFITFCEKDTNIIEIMKNGSNGLSVHQHYINIAKQLDFKNYKNYNNIIEDKHGNFNLNIEDFKLFYLRT